MECADDDGEYFGGLLVGVVDVRAALAADFTLVPSGSVCFRRSKTSGAGVRRPVRQGRPALKQMPDSIGVLSAGNFRSAYVQALRNGPPGSFSDQLHTSAALIARL